jgi:DNA primase
LVAAVENIPLVEAANRLAGANFATSHTRRRPVPQSTVPEWTKPNWQAGARAVIGGAKGLLQPGSIGAEYLQSRGIDSSTRRAFSLGQRHIDWRHGGESPTTRPAVVIPWIDARGTCTAIKYRFCDERAATDKSARFDQKWGSQQTIFGAQLATGEAETLVVTEGEFNAMSVWQAGHSQGYHVLSLGPRNNAIGLRALQRLITRRQYRRVITWLDEAVDATQTAVALDAVAMKSPNGNDANAILQTFGPTYLLALIEAVLRRSAAPR